MFNYQVHWITVTLKSWCIYMRLTCGAHNSSILIMWTPVKPNPTVTAAQKRGLCSSTSHTSQIYWTSPLSKGCIERSNRAYRKPPFIHSMIFQVQLLNTSVHMIFGAMHNYLSFTVNTVQISTWSWKSQLSAHNHGIIVIPAIITHCSPHSIDADLHSASTLQRSIDQMKCSICATLRSYTEEINTCFLFVCFCTC